MMWLISLAALVGLIPSGQTKNSDDIFSRPYGRDDSPYLDRPVKVCLGVTIDDVYTIDHKGMSMVLYLRQFWRDPRLTYDPRDLPGVIKLESSRLSQIWSPDTFLPDERKSHELAVLGPSRLLTLNSLGQILYEAKLSLVLSCHMKLHKFPLDTQVCPITFKSYGYGLDTLYYDWLDPPVEFDPDLELPGFTLLDTLLYDCVQNYTTDTHACLMIKLVLQRNIRPYVMRVYLPSFGLIIIAWLTFWLPSNALTTRVLLLLPPSLLLPSMWMWIMPGVPYMTALDIWMMACGVFLLCVYVELALVSALSEVTEDEDVSNDECKGDSLLDKAKIHLTRKVGESLKVDKICRFVFATAFLLFACAYWTGLGLARGI